MACHVYGLFSKQTGMNRKACLIPPNFRATQKSNYGIFVVPANSNGHFNAPDRWVVQRKYLIPPSI